MDRRLRSRASTYRVRRSAWPRFGARRRMSAGLVLGWRPGRPRPQRGPMDDDTPLPPPRADVPPAADIACGAHPGRRRRLGLRAVARQLLSRGPAAGARARVREPAADRDRDQRHLLPAAEARELRQVARRDARRLRLHASRPRGTRPTGASSPRRASRSGASSPAASPSSGPSSGRSSGSSRRPSLRRRRLRGLPAPAAARARRPGAAPRGRGAPRRAS